MNDKKGFTLIEILVVAGIIGLLGVLATVALTSARVRARDAKRMADIVKTQMALELYFNDNNSYPVVATATALGQAGTTCLSSEGFVPSCDATAVSVYLARIPTTPEAGLEEMVQCSGINNAYCFVGNASEYRIQFELETDNPEAGLVKGANCASEAGVESGACTSIE